MKPIIISFKKYFIRLVVIALLVISFVQSGTSHKLLAANTWTEISDNNFSDNNQAIRRFNQFAGVVFFTTESVTEPFEAYGYYSGELISFSSGAPFYNADGAIRVKNVVFIGGPLGVVVETSVGDELWMYAGEWENITSDLPVGTIGIDYFSALGEFALMALLQLDNGEGVYKDLLASTGSGWFDFGEISGIDINNTELLDSLYVEFEGSGGIFMSVYDTNTEIYSIIGLSSGGEGVLYSSEYPIYDIAFYGDSLYILNDSSEGVEIQQFAGSLETVLSGLSGNITEGKFAQTNDYLYAAFSKATTGGPAELYRSDNGTEWEFLTNVVGNGEEELAWVTDIIALENDLLLATAQRGEGPINAQLWLLEIDETEHLDNDDTDEENSPSNETGSNTNTASTGQSQNYSNSATTTDESESETISDENLEAEGSPLDIAPSKQEQVQTNEASPNWGILLAAVVTLGTISLAAFFGLKKLKLLPTNRMARIRASE